MVNKYIIGENKKKIFLIGYRAEGIKTYRSSLKPAGYVVASAGFLCLGVALFPNGLGVFFYPAGFSLLGCVGISTLKLEKKIKDKLRFIKWRITHK